MRAFFDGVTGAPKPDGFHCSTLAAYSGFWCVGQQQDTGLQCAETQRCTGATKEGGIQCSAP